jgi:hypothetical protein
MSTVEERLQRHLVRSLREFFQVEDSHEPRLDGDGEPGRLTLSAVTWGLQIRLEAQIVVAERV